MSYLFSPIRFSAITFGLSVAAVLLAAGVSAVIGVRLAGGFLAALPIIVATALEARRFGRSLTAPPQTNACWRLAAQTAITGSVTYLILLLVGALLLRGTQALSQPSLWAQPLMITAAIGICVFVSGYFIIRSIAQAAWKERA